jgi:hypothetical protein
MKRRKFMALLGGAAAMGATRRLGKPVPRACLKPDARWLSQNSATFV